MRGDPKALIQLKNIRNNAQETFHDHGSIASQKVLVLICGAGTDSKLALKDEVEGILTEDIPDLTALSRPGFSRLLDERFCTKGWTRQPAVFQDAQELGAKMDLLKERIGVELEFGHFCGIVTQFVFSKAALQCAPRSLASALHIP